ncbi:MAG: amidohydrolase family protein, partial [Xanthomonadales bacterium]|nr:amidohydrolase family protein [Xanthomonadales bacterium]
HCNRRKALFEQACELTKKGCSIDVTAFPPSDNIDEYSAAEAFVRFQEKGLDMQKFTISSDGGGCLPQFNTQGELIRLDYGRCTLLSETLKELLDKNTNVTEVISVFTRNVASLLKLKQKGEVAVGKDADLVILDADNQIESVMALGQWHQKNQQTIKFGGFEK